MIIKQLTLATLDTGTLDFGFVGENEHIKFVIKCDSVFDEYPTATASLLIKAPDNTIYPKTVEVEGYNVGWVITASDTAYPGSGQIQLTFTEDGAVVKTVIANTNVKDSLVGDDPPPDPIADWISTANQILGKVDGMTATAESLPSGDDPSVTVETVDGHYNLEFGIPAGDPGDPTEIIDDNAGVGDVTKVWSANKSATELSELKSEIDRKAPAIYQDASGDIVSFADGADNMPLSSCVVQIDPVQSGTGDPSPTNVRPITGHTGAKIWNDPVHGGNINWNQLRLDSTNAFTGDGVTSKIDATTHKVSIKNDSRTSNFNTGSSQVHLTSIAPIEGHKYYYASNSRESGVYISTANLSQLFGSSYPLGSIITAPAGATTFRLRLTSAYDFVTAHPVDDVYEFYLNIFDLTQMFGAGNEPTAAEIDELFPKPWYALNAGEITCVSAVNGDPYAVYPISWQTAAGTVYGGNVNPLTGVLTVDSIMMEITATTTPSSTRANRNSVYTGNFAIPAPGDRSGAIYCNCLGIYTNSNIYNYGTALTVGLSPDSGSLYVMSTDQITNATGFTAWLTALGTIQVVYKLATPQTYQLDPVQITALKESNIWADTGAISLTYPADTRTYVDGAIATATDPDGNVVTVTGSTPSITGESGKRYVCGTVDSISITPPQTGIIDVVFTSGTTPTVLTVPNTVRFPAWFDSTSLDASATYEINIQDGLGAVSKWT